MSGALGNQEPLRFTFIDKLVDEAIGSQHSSLAQDHRLGQWRDEASGREHQQSVQVPVPALQDAFKARPLPAVGRFSYAISKRTYASR